MYKKTLVVNLYGGPGSGKSTAASELFSMLKRQGVDCEIASEFAKDLVWEQRHYALSDQVYIMAKQNHRLFRLNHKVEVIITDSPLLLSIIYKPEGYDFLNRTAASIYNKYNNIDFFIKRVEPFNPNGRNENAEQAKQKDREIKEMLENYVTSIYTVEGNKEGSTAICSLVMEEVKKNRREFGE